MKQEDREALQKFGRMLGQPLKKTNVELEELHRISDYNYCYVENTEGHVVGISIRKTNKDYILHILAVFESLQHLVLRDNQISDLSPLKELHNLTNLYLIDNQISDLSPLKELHNLTSLNLGGNQISDLSPLKELHNLTGLSLSGNQISDLSPLKELHNLTSLNLGGNQISDLSPLKELHNLTGLSLSGNQISDLSPLKELHNLTSLNLGGNQISDLSPLKELHNLTSLNLGGNQISDLSPLKELHNLTSLNLGGNQISDLSPLKELHNLTNLYLIDNQISDLSPLKELHNLTSLNLGGNQISDLSPLKELHNLTGLSLSGNQISDLSPLKELHNLTSLNLGGNQISDLSPLKELHNLTGLSLSGNQISDLSPLKELHNLTSLNLGGNQISDLSPLKELHNLTSLNLGGNQISDLSPLKELHNLTSLNLGGNQISDLSPLKELHNLTNLYLIDNQISDLSPLKELHNLTSLNLGGNQISDLSPLKELHNLTGLSLSGNQISDLRPLYETIKANENIRLFCTNYSYDDNVFTFGDNPLDSPPKEIIEQGREEVLRYFESKELIEVNECKVLVVGEGESGKTTLIKRYLGEEIPDEEDKTDGIFIKQSIIKDIQLEDSTTKDITLNIWDFGGQEIYLQVHKFFLTEKSLYILVVSSRTDDKARKEIYDGLRLIKSYGGESSPIIVVGNKADQNEHFSFIDEKTLQEEGFTNPIFFCKLSAKFGNDFPEGNYRGEFDFSNFEKCLRRALPKVENITQKWPKEYIRIKNEIEKEDEKYISEEKFREICTQNNANKDYQQLAKLFNNLGTFTHFEDEDVRTLQELFITKPEWATNAVYDILGSRELLDEEKGSIVFDPATWHEIFKRKNHEDIYKKEHATYIKELIKKFYIGYECTKTNNQNILLIPSVLGEEQPDNDFDIYHADNLHVRIQYKTYFSYILPQLMARMHEDLTDIKWKGGAIFEKNGATAKVIANQYEERIDIFVQGTLERKRTYLNHIWETLEIIQKNIDKRSYEYLVAIDKKSDKEWEYENYEELLRLEARGKTQYITGKKDYSLSEILSGIKTKEQRIQEVHKYNFYGPINNPKFQSGRGSIQSEGGVIVSHGDDAKITQTNIWNNYGQAIALMENIVDSLEEIVRDKKFEDLQYSQRSAVKDAKNATEETIEILKNKDATEEKKKSTLSEWKNIFGEKIKKLQPLAIASTLIANAPKAMQNIDDAFKSILKYLS